MIKLMQDLCSSGVEMSIRPSGSIVDVHFFHREINIGRTYALKSVDICDAQTSMEKHIQKLLEGFLKQVDEVRRGK